jgi:hypothetical protein
MALTDMLRGRQVVQFLTNKSGGAVINGDVVIVDTGNDAAFTTTTSAQSLLVRGVVQESIANNATGRVCTGGYVPLVNVPASVTRGHFIETHTVAKQATGNSTRRTGTFGQFWTGGTTPSGNLFGLVDTTAAAGSTVASDTIWDAAGDLIQGTGADTGAKLTIGAAGTMLRSTGSAAAWAVPAKVLIDSQLRATDGTFSFTSIAGTYNHLEVLIIGRLATAAVVEDFVHIKFNNDGGSNYTRQLINGSATTVAAGEVVAAGAPGTASFCGYLPAASSAATSAGCMRILVPGYALTTFMKNALVDSGYVNATTTQDRIVQSIVRYNQTGAITQIDLTGNGGSFLTASKAWLYGIT